MDRSITEMPIGLEKYTAGYKALNFAVKCRCGSFYISPTTSKHTVSILVGLVER